MLLFELLDSDTGDKFEKLCREIQRSQDRPPDQDPAVFDVEKIGKLCQEILKDDDDRVAREDFADVKVLERLCRLFLRVFSKPSATSQES